MASNGAPPATASPATASPAIEPPATEPPAFALPPLAYARPASAPPATASLASVPPATAPLATAPPTTAPLVSPPPSYALLPLPRVPHGIQGQHAGGNGTVPDDDGFYEPNGDLVYLLPTAEEAPFDSPTNLNETLCTPTTRTDVLVQIQDWFNGRHQNCIFWLSGPSGMGMSTIARTVAHTYHAQGQLGASFFFSRGGGDVSNASKFFTTLATQLARLSPSLEGLITAAIYDNEDIGTRALREQWHLLIEQPLLRTELDRFPSPLLLVIDALDECEGEEDVKLIIELLSCASALGRIPLRVLVTGRADTLVRLGFDNINGFLYRDFLLEDVPREVVDNDIAIYFQQQLGGVELGGEDWDWDVPKRLVAKAGGLFLWAATACRFINDGRQLPIQRLSLILAHGGSRRRGEKELDELYRTILRASLPENGDQGERKALLCGFFKQVLGAIMALLRPLSAVALSLLLHENVSEVRQKLDGLYSVLEVPESLAYPIRLLHPSFRDFLFSQERCQDSRLWVDEKQTHWDIAMHCVRLMSRALKRDICCLDAPRTRVTDVETCTIDGYISPEVQYACLYWVQHIEMCKAELCDNDQVHQFLQDSLLHWLEALSLMQSISDGVLALISLEAMASANKGSKLSEFIYEAQRFVIYNRSVIEQTPLQLYSSALIFAPEKSLVRKRFADQIPDWIERLPDIPKDWGLNLQTLGHDNCPYSVAFSPNGKWLASGCRGSKARLWDVATGALSQTFEEGHDSDVRTLAFSPDGKKLAMGSHCNVLLWDTDGSNRQRLGTHELLVKLVEFSPDGQRLASASRDRTVKIWNAETRQLVSTLKSSAGKILAIGFSRDSTLLVSASSYGKIQVWNLATATTILTIADCLARMTAVSFSPNGKNILSSDFDTIKVWDSATGAKLRVFKADVGRVNAFTFSPDGKRLASASKEKMVNMWDSETGNFLQAFEGHTDGVKAVAFSPDGKLLASASWDMTVKLWDAEKRQPFPLGTRRNRFRSVIFSPDGKWVASTSGDKIVRLWNVATGVVQMLDDHARWINDLTFSPDGSLLASAADDSTIRVWTVTMGSSALTLEGHMDKVASIVFSADGKQLASAAWDKTVRLWDLETRKVTVFQGHRDRVDFVAMSSNGQRLASTSSDETVRLWDTATGTSLWNHFIGFGGQNYIAFSQSGNSVAVKLWPHRLQVTSVETADPESGPKILSGFHDSISALAFSSDDKWLAAACTDKTIRLWHMEPQREVAVCSPGVVIKRLSFSSDDSKLETERGTIDVGLFASGGDLPPLRPQNGLFVEDGWVTYGTNKFLWLPAEYRTSVVAIHGNVLALLQESGHVLFCHFRFQ